MPGLEIAQRMAPYVAVIHPDNSQGVGVRADIFATRSDRVANLDTIAQSAERFTHGRNFAVFARERIARIIATQPEIRHSAQELIDTVYYDLNNQRAELMQRQANHVVPIRYYRAGSMVLGSLTTGSIGVAGFISSRLAELHASESNVVLKKHIALLVMSTLGSGTCGLALRKCMFHLEKHAAAQRQLATKITAVTGCMNALQPARGPSESPRSENIV